MRPLRSQGDTRCVQRGRYYLPGWVDVFYPKDFSYSRPVCSTCGEIIRDDINMNTALLQLRQELEKGDRTNMSIMPKGVYKNLKRAAMTDEELLPQVRVQIEGMWNCNPNMEVPLSLLLTDISFLGRSEMLLIAPAYSDGETYNSRYYERVAGDYAEELHGARFVIIAEMHQNGPTVLRASFVHGVNDTCLSILWPIAEENTRRLLSPEVVQLPCLLR